MPPGFPRSPRFPGLLHPRSVRLAPHPCTLCGDWGKPRLWAPPCPQAAASPLRPQGHTQTGKVVVCVGRWTPESATCHTPCNNAAERRNVVRSGMECASPLPRGRDCIGLRRLDAARDLVKEEIGPFLPAHLIQTLIAVGRRPGYRGGRFLRPSTSHGILPLVI